MNVTTKLRRWGNSYGIVIPIEIIKERKMKEGEEIIAQIDKKKEILELFGSLKEWKINSQKVKDRLRKEWSR